MGSGGGGDVSQVATSGIADEFLPYIKPVLADAAARYEQRVEAGPESMIAEMTQGQKDALAASEAYAKDMMAGTGIFDTTAAQEADLKGILGSNMGQASTGGMLGSARSQAAINQALADRSLEFAKDRQQTATLGADLLGQVGGVRQQYKQQLLDAPDLSAERVFGLFKNAPQQTTTTQTGGGK